MPGVLRTATGKPGEVICRIAEEENAAMIVTGTRGLGKVRRTILGSVSDYLVNHAHCPVIICRHPNDRRNRRPSGQEGKKSRHSSGESFAQALRQRFSSGGKSKSQSSMSSEAESEDLEKSKGEKEKGSKGKEKKGKDGSTSGEEKSDVAEAKKEAPEA